MVGEGCCDIGPTTQINGKINNTSFSFPIGETVKIDGNTYKYLISPESISCYFNEEYFVLAKGADLYGLLYYKETAIAFNSAKDTGLQSILTIQKRIFSIFGNFLFSLKLKRKQEVLVNKDYILPKHPECKQIALGLFWGILLYRMVIDARDFD
jgi:hypothetical protein